MTLDDLTAKNEKFQQGVAQITELVQHPTILDHCTMLIRSAKRMDNNLRKVIRSNSESLFNTHMGSIEEETDEIIFLLDQLSAFDKVQVSRVMVDLVKEGFDVLSIYALACDKIIEKRVAKEDEFDN